MGVFWNKATGKTLNENEIGAAKKLAEIFKILKIYAHLFFVFILTIIILKYISNLQIGWFEKNIAGFAILINMFFEMKRVFK